MHLHLLQEAFPDGPGHPALGSCCPLWFVLTLRFQFEALPRVGTSSSVIPAVDAQGVFGDCDQCQCPLSVYGCAGSLECVHARKVLRCRLSDKALCQQCLSIPIIIHNPTLQMRTRKWAHSFIHLFVGSKKYALLREL